MNSLDSGIDIGQVINVGPGKLGKKNRLRALNKRREIPNKYNFVSHDFLYFLIF